MGSRRGTWPWLMVLAVLALAGGLGAGIAALMHMAYVLLALLLLCPLYARLSLRATRLTHHASTTRLFVGERLLEVYAVRTRTYWPMLGLEVAPGRGPGGERAAWSLSLAPRGHDELTSVSVASQRGRYHVGGAVVAVADPFGLVVARRRLPAVTEVVVWPRARIIPDFSLAVARAGDLLPARRSWATMPVSGAVRPFALGDPSTRIHWLSSARHGFLMVKDSDKSVGQRLWVALDLSSPDHAGMGEEGTVEYGVEAAAYVLELAYKAGLDVGLIVTGAHTLVAEPRRGGAQREYLLDLLAVARAGEGPSLAETLEERRVARPSDAVVILAPGVPLELLDLLARLRRLGCGVAVALLDAPSFGGTAKADVDPLQADHIPIYWITKVGR